MPSAILVPKSLKLDSHNSLTEQFAKWIFDASDGFKVVSKQKIAQQISRLQNGSEVTDGKITSWIAKARLYCENHLGCTLWNMPGEGWRRSTERETAVYYCKSIKKTIAWADRTRSLQSITRREHIPSAMKEVFYKAEGGVNALSKTKGRYFELWMNYMDKEKEKNAPLIIESKK